MMRIRKAFACCRRSLSETMRGSAGAPTPEGRGACQWSGKEASSRLPADPSPSAVEAPYREVEPSSTILLLAVGVPLVVALRSFARVELRAEHALLPCEGGHCPVTFCKQAFKLCDPHTIRQIVTHVGSPRSRFFEALLLQLAHLGAQGTVQHCMAVGPCLGILQQLLKLRDHHAFVASLPVLPRLSGAGCRKLLPEILDLCGLCILCSKGLAVKRAWVLPL